MNSISHRSPRAGLVAVALFTAAALAVSTGAIAADGHHTVVTADGVGAVGPGAPVPAGGGKGCSPRGRSGQGGPVRASPEVPAGYVIPPHRHSKDELVTVMNRKVVIDAGEQVDRTLKSLPAGTFVNLPAGMAHYARADGEAVVQINGTGPFDITYVNPKDDPRSMAKMSSR